MISAYEAKLTSQKNHAAKVDLSFYQLSAIVESGILEAVHEGLSRTYVLHESFEKETVDKVRAWLESSGYVVNVNSIYIWIYW